MSIYTELGVRQVINAWGPMTIIGSALVRPEVVTTMAEAAAWYVDVVATGNSNIGKTGDRTNAVIRSATWYPRN